VLVFVVHDGDLTRGRVGLYSWGNADGRFSEVRVYPQRCASRDWLFDEPFQVLIPSVWAFIDEGDQDQPSRWSVDASGLRQTSTIHGGDPAVSALNTPGTYALAGEATWTDYRLTVRLTSTTDQAIGVMFRYRDGRNYYRYSMDRARKYRRLVKQVDGLFTVLWEDAARFTVGREYVFTVDCVGDRLTGYLDGVHLFSVTDGGHAAGRVALYGWSNPGVVFREVRVSSPVWSTYYTNLLRESDILRGGGLQARRV